MALHLKNLMGRWVLWCFWRWYGRSKEKTTTSRGRGCSIWRSNYTALLLSTCTATCHQSWCYAVLSLWMLLTLAVFDFQIARRWKIRDICINPQSEARDLERRRLTLVTRESRQSLPKGGCELQRSTFIYSNNYDCKSIMVIRFRRRKSPAHYSLFQPPALSAWVGGPLYSTCPL
jgi:hypothetical protein